MKKRILIVLTSLALVTVAAATGCTSSYATSDQVMYLQNQVNSLSGSLNSTQQELASTQQQLKTAQQSLADAQAKQQNTYVTTAQPSVVYQPGIVYGVYSYGTPWYTAPVRPVHPVYPQPRPLPQPQPGPHPAL